MLTQINNRHYSMLPNIGDIVCIQGLEKCGYNPRERFEAVAYPLNDNCVPYSYGVHSVFLKSLWNGRVVRVSGHWCVEDRRGVLLPKRVKTQERKWKSTQ